MRRGVVVDDRDGAAGRDAYLAGELEVVHLEGGLRGSTGVLVGATLGSALRGGSLSVAGAVAPLWCVPAAMGAVAGSADGSSVSAPTATPAPATQASSDAVSPSFMSDPVFEV